jgi:hypothetical protein
VYFSPFFNISQEGGYAFRLGLRLEYLDGGKIVTARDLGMHEAFLKRLERFPLDRARIYQQRMEEMGTKSVREFARKVGEDWSVVSRHLRLLQLPSDVVGFLDQSQIPEVLRHFTAKRLGDLTRLPRDKVADVFRQQLSQLGLDA